MGSPWGAADDAESMATLNRALDLGVNPDPTAHTRANITRFALGPLRGHRSSVDVVIESHHMHGTG